MFKYKLEPVLSLKEKIEDNKKRELAIVNGRYQSLQQQKKDLIQNKELAIEQAKKQSDKRVNIQMLKQLTHYTAYMDRAIEEKSKEVVVAAAQVEEKRNELIEAVKQRKILDKLKEIQFEVYKDEEKQEENRIMDEIVTYRFGTKKEEDE